MRKVSLFFLVAALLGAALILGGCGNPTNGDDGAAGQTVGFIVSGTVNAADLAAAFKLTNVLTLGSGVTSVYGEVPADKKLAVAGTSTAVTAGEILEINGALEVYEGAKLNASYVSGAAGYLKGTAANVSGKGTVTLPYIKSGVPDKPADIITYTDTLTGIVKSVGAYLTTSAAAPGGALTNTEIVSLWKDVTDLDELTVGNITALTAAAVPKDKTLTLTGTTNTVTVDLDLSAAGELIVATGATLTTANSLKGVTNNGTISSSTTTGTVATGLLGLAGTGTISFTDTVDLGGTTTLELEQNVVVATSGKTLTAPDFAGAAFSGDKTITVSTGGTLALPAKVTSIGATVENKGTVTTATTVVGSLNTILSAIGGDVTASAITTGSLIVPKDVKLTLGANFAGAAADVITVNGTLITGDTATFSTISTGSITVGEDGTFTCGDKVTLASLQNLTVNGTFTGGTATTLAAVKTLEVNGTLTADKATLATVTTLEVNGTLFALAATLAAIDATTDITGTGTLVIGAAMDATKVKFVIESALKGANIGSAAITDDDLVIPADTYRYFTGKAAPSAKVTVNGMLGVSGTGSLTIAAGAELANAGTIALTETGSVVLTGAASTGGAKLTGTGKLTAGKTEIVGGTSGWQAVSSASTTITIASSATEDTATITASANTVVLTAQGAGATITQLAGAGNALTIAAATTVDVSAAGSLILKGAASNGAKVTLAADTAIIKGAGTTGSVTTANITKIGDVAIDNLTVGTNTVFTDNGSGNAFFTITGGSGGAGSIEAKADLTLDKDTTLTYS